MDKYPPVAKIAPPTFGPVVGWACVGLLAFIAAMLLMLFWGLVVLPEMRRYEFQRHIEQLQNQQRF